MAKTKTPNSDARNRWWFFAVVALVLLGADGLFPGDAATIVRVGLAGLAVIAVIVLRARDSRSRRTESDTS